jgi:hypothetical protein
MIDPADRPDEGDVLTQEVRFNSGSEGSARGPLTMFEQYELVRYLNQGGPATQIQPRGVSNWEVVGGGYQVQLNYRVATEEVAFDLQLTVHGSEGRHKRSGGGRQWAVVRDKTFIRQGSEVVTPAGRRRAEVVNQGRRLMGEWLRDIYEGRFGEAYLLTVAPEDRTPLRRQHTAALLLNGPALGTQLACAVPAALLVQAAATADPELADRLSLRDYRDFRDGNPVRLAPDFWAPDRLPDHKDASGKPLDSPKQVREAILAAVRREFRKPGRELAAFLQPDQNVHVPVVRIDGDRFRVEQDMTLQMMEDRFTVEARLVVDCDAKEAADGSAPPERWRVRSLDLIRGKTYVSGHRMARMPVPGTPP